MIDASQVLADFGRVCYLAGIIDGEGCLSIKSKYDSLRGRSYYSITLSIRSTSEFMLQFIQSKFGGHLTSSKDACKEHARSYLLEWYGQEAKKVVEKVKDLLLIKAQHATVFLKFPLNDGTEKHKFSKEENLLRDSLYAELKFLNRRGGEE